MKRLLMLVGCSGALLCGADLAGVHTVYVMPMARGLDQYLASRISTGAVFQVVTDPKLADAVLTDSLGETFQARLEAISPTPKPPAPEKSEAEKAAAAEKADKVEKPAKPTRRSAADEAASVLGMFQDTEGKTAAPMSSFSRGKGTIFLVDEKSRQVVWSTFDPSKGTRNHDLDRTASDIVSRLKKDLKPKNLKVREADVTVVAPEVNPKPAPPAPATPPAATPAPAPTTPAPAPKK